MRFDYKAIIGCLYKFRKIFIYLSAKIPLASEIGRIPCIDRRQKKIGILPFRAK